MKAEREAYESDSVEIGMQVGAAAFAGLPYDLTDDEAEEIQEEIRAAVERRRPPGFSAWPA